MLNKQSRTADKGWSSRVVVCRGANNSPSKGHVLRSASVDVFGDSVMGCDAESLGDLFTLLPKRRESITHIPERSPYAKKRDTGLRTCRRNSYRFCLGNVNEEQLGSSRIILKSVLKKQDGWEWAVLILLSRGTVGGLLRKR